MPPPTANDPWLSGRHFGIVIDAGSSGSRLQIYSWKDPRTIHVPKGSELARSLPKVEKGTKGEEDWVKKVEPGLSSLADSPQDVGAYLQPLLHHALDQIPPSLHAQTPIFLLATAGMRLLPPKKQAQILQETCRFFLQNSNFKVGSPNAVGPCGSSVRIITGEEEGLFGWIAINYLMDGFKVADNKGIGRVEGERTTYGFLDMGGASTQIAFEPAAEHRNGGNHLIDVRLRLMGGEEIHHKVFVTTWLGYGTNQARERYVGKAITDYEAGRMADDEDVLQFEEANEDGEDDDVVPDPCLPKNLELVESPVHTKPVSPHSRVSHKLRGTGSFEKCLRATAPLLNKQKPCHHQHCLMNGVSVPPIDFSVSRFIGVSEYWYSSEHIFGLGGAYNFVQYERAASEFCSKDWKELVRMHEESRRKQRLGGDGEVVGEGGEVVGIGKWGPQVEIPRLQMQCFKAAWITNVLHEGLGLPRIVDPGGNKTTGGKEVEEEAAKKGLGRPAFQSMDTVGDLAISWTLGKMVLEASKEVPPLNKMARPLVDPIDDIEDLANSPIQPIRPPFLSIAGLEDRINPHLPASLTKENLGFSPVLVFVYLLMLFALFIICFPLRRQLRSFFLRSMHNVAKRDAYADLMEEGRVNGSRPSSPTPWTNKLPTPIRRYFPSNRSPYRPLTLKPVTTGQNRPLRIPSGPSSSGSSRPRPPITPTRSFSTPPQYLPPSISVSASTATQFAHSRSPSPAPSTFMLDDEAAASLVSSRSRNASTMSLTSLAPRPAAMSRMNSSHSVHKYHEG